MIWTRDGWRDVCRRPRETGRFPRAWVLLVTGKMRRYLRWWFIDHKWSGLVVSGPIFVLLGALGVAGAAADGEWHLSLAFLGFPLFGLLIIFGDLWLYRGKAKPWDDLSKPSTTEI